MWFWLFEIDYGKKIYIIELSMWYKWGLVCDFFEGDVVVKYFFNIINLKLLLKRINK